VSQLAEQRRTLASGVSAVNAELERIFNSAPKEEPRSRLEPYRELILRWRNFASGFGQFGKLPGATLTGSIRWKSMGFV
jgi:hypothetical protein